MRNESYVKIKEINSVMKMNLRHNPRKIISLESSRNYIQEFIHDAIKLKYMEETLIKRKSETCCSSRYSFSSSIANNLGALFERPTGGRKLSEPVCSNSFLNQKSS